MKYTIQRRKTLPIPGLEYSSMGWIVGVEGDEGQSYDEVSKKVEELERIEAELRIPDYITSVDKLSSLKKFLTLLAANPTIGRQVQLEWKKYITPSPQLSND